MVHFALMFRISTEEPFRSKFSKSQQVLAPLHYHNEFELLVATKGKILVQTEGETYLLSEGDGLFINSGLLHTISTTEEPHGEPGFIAVVFDYSALCWDQDAVYTNYVQPLLNGSLEPEPRLHPEACAAVHAICDIHETGSYGGELYIKHCLFHIFYLLLREAKTVKLSTQSTKSTIIKTVLDYIKQNYREPITLEQLAKQAHVSREYLCRLFHRLSGSSLIEYLNRYRIRQSTFLLLQTDNSISDIALSCGFSHSSYFGKLFLEYMGDTPTNYRKKYRK